MNQAVGFAVIRRSFLYFKMNRKAESEAAAVIYYTKQIVVMYFMTISAIWPKTHCDD